MADDYSRRFELKGKKAEEFLYTLAVKTFLTDWCYLNTNLPNGKELCDLLVVFGDTVIIWQVKDLKLNEHGRYSESEVEKNFRQLAGARRMLFEVKAPLDLEKPRRGKERFDPSTIKHVYLISAFLGETEDYYRLFGEAKNNAVHVFTREFTEILLTELDTIADFTQYLAVKEASLFHGGAPAITLLGGEEELLAIYIQGNRSFSYLEEEATQMMLQGGFWENLQQNPDYRAKKAADGISYHWDQVIDGAHLSGVPEYEQVAREMAKLNRFERRTVGQAMADAWAKAQEVSQQGGNVFRRAVMREETAFCFLFADKNTISPETRREMLQAFCFITRGTQPPQRMVQNDSVIGIATEIQPESPGSYDVAYLYHPDWTAEDDQIASELKERFSIGKKVVTQQVQFHEYPQRGEGGDG
jgi:hypothetical protein